MLKLSTLACLATTAFAVTILPAAANTDREDMMSVINGNQPAASQNIALAPRSKANRAGQSTANHTGHSHGMSKQTAGVVTSCFPGSLRAALSNISGHFGGEIIVTSGFRSHSHNRRAGGARHSTHISCQAADIQIAGISPGAIARYARSLPGVGGVGTYGHTRSVHVDVGARKFAWHGRKSKRYA